MSDSPENTPELPPEVAALMEQQEAELQAEQAHDAEIGLQRALARVEPPES